jgi:hypothetical protein
MEFLKDVVRVQNVISSLVNNIKCCLNIVDGLSLKGYNLSLYFYVSSLKLYNAVSD